MEFLMHPCPFGVTLQQGTQLIALLNTIIAVLILIIFALFFFEFEMVAIELGIGSQWQIIFIWVVLFIILGGNVAIHYILLIGAKERSQKKVKIYLIVCVAFMILGLLLAVWRTPSLATVIIYLLGDIVPMYLFWVVFRFYKQLQAEGQCQPQGDGDVEKGYGGV